MATQRKSELSVLNTLLCLIVILIHINSFAVVGYQVGTVKHSFAVLISYFLAFVVQGFVLLSGVKSCLGNKEYKYTLYLKKRFIGIIIPYAVAFVVYYILYVIFYNYPVNFILASKKFLLGSLTYHLYFIPIIVQFDLLMPLWKKIVSKCSAIIVIPFSILVSNLFEQAFPQMISAVFPNVNFIYNDRLFTTYLAYYIIGCYIGRYYDDFKLIVRKKFKLITFTTILVTFLHGTLSMLSYNLIMHVPYINSIHFIYCITIIIFLFSLAITVPSKWYDNCTLILRIDKESYNIYLWHVLVLSFINFVISYFGIQSQLLCYIIRILWVYPVTIIGCNLLSKIKNFVFSRQ